MLGIGTFCRGIFVGAEKTEFEASRSVAAYPPGIELPDSTPEDGVQLEEAAGNEEDLEAATVGSSWEEDPCCFKSVDGRKVHGDSALLRS